jgi:hypothetical protein
MDTYDRAYERAMAGAAVLGRLCPGWPDMVDLSRLDMASGSECIAGQVFADRAEQGGYVDGWTYLRRTQFGADPDRGYQTMRTYGFDSAGSVGYLDLEEAWIEVVTNIRDAEHSAPRV